MVSAKLMFRFAVIFIKVKYNALFYDTADPRIRDKLFMGSPLELVLTYLSYVLITTYLIPRFMRDRKPYDFKTLCGYVEKTLLVIESYFLYWGILAWTQVYNWNCQSIDTSESREALLAIEICWQFLIARFLYTLQSLPHALSKKKSPKVNFMLLHHTVFPIFVWSAVNYYPGGHVTFIGFIISLANFISSIFRLVAKNIPTVKKYEASVDKVANIVKFFICTVHSIQVYFTTDCEVPQNLIHLEVSGLIFFAIMYYLIVGRRKSGKLDMSENSSQCSTDESSVASSV